MKTTIPLMLWLHILFVAPGVEAASSAACPQEPGTYKAISTGDKQHENVIDVHIPKAYADKGSKKFPVLYMVSCWGCKDFYRLETWAEDAEFILVDLSRVDYRTSAGDAKEILRDADKFLSDLRVHPSLRFIYATWWVGYQGSWMYNDNARSIAGLILAGRVPDVAVEKSTTVAVMCGASPDSLARSSRILAGIERLRRQNCQVIGELMYGKTASADPDNGTLERVLDAAYVYQSLANPRLSDKEIQENHAIAEARIARLSAGGDARERFTRLTTLVRTPRIETLKCFGALTEAWYRTLVEVFKSASPQEAFVWLNDPSVARLVKAMPNEYRKDFSGPHGEMMKNKDYLQEVAANTALAAVLSHYDEAADRNDEKRLRKVKEEITEFIENYAGTVAADTARSTKSCIDVDERKK